MRAAEIKAPIEPKSCPNAISISQLNILSYHVDSSLVHGYEDLFSLKVNTNSTRRPMYPNGQLGSYRQALKGFLSLRRLHEDGIRIYIRILDI